MKNSFKKCKSVNIYQYLFLLYNSTMKGEILQEVTFLDDPHPTLEVPGKLDVELVHEFSCCGEFVMSRLENCQGRMSI